MRTPIVNRDSPRLQVNMDWGSQRPIGGIALYVGRVGEPTDFAVYQPIEERGGELLFEFDDLLFYREPGVYLARLTVGANEYTSFMFMYRDDIRLMSYGNPDHV